jgi:hypothetical protein
MAAPIHMPARGEDAAPTFDKTKPRELLRYFDDLEYLFDRAMITSEPDKKRQLLRYVDFETEQIWKVLPEYKSVASSYLDFKKAILFYYPDASSDSLYSISDLNLLIRESQQHGISSTNELSDFHLRFLTITSWLIKNGLLGNLEQQRSYIQVFQPPLRAAITRRLQLKFQDHHPNVPHEIQDVYDAAQFILQFSTTATQEYSPPLPTSIFRSPEPAPITPATSTMTEAKTITTILSEVTKSIVKAINQQAATYSVPVTSSYQKTPQESTNNRIAAIEAELAQLRARKSIFTSQVCSSTREARKLKRDPSEDSSTSECPPQIALANKVKQTIAPQHQAIQPLQTVPIRPQSTSTSVSGPVSAKIILSRPQSPIQAISVVPGTQQPRQIAPTAQISDLQPGTIPHHHIHSIKNTTCAFHISDHISAPVAPQAHNVHHKISLFIAAPQPQIPAPPYLSAHSPPISSSYVPAISSSVPEISITPSVSSSPCLQSPAVFTSTSIVPDAHPVFLYLPYTPTTTSTSRTNNFQHNSVTDKLRNSTMRTMMKKQSASKLVLAARIPPEPPDKSCIIRAITLPIILSKMIVLHHILSKTIALSIRHGRVILCTRSALYFPSELYFSTLF